MGFHDTAGVGDIHIPYQWAYADQSARESATGFVSADLGKLARQLDNNSLWLLVAITPTWVAASGGGGGSSDASRVVYSARKSTAGTINAGQAVRLTGVSDGFVQIELAQADSDATMPCFGIASATITDTAEGNVIFLGKLENIDTSSWSVGAELYVSASVAGGLTATRPTGTAVVQYVAKVLASHATTGALGVLGDQPHDLPNIANGKVWKGDASGYPQEVDFVHKDTHKSEGGDAFLSTDLLEAIVKRLQESGGPTTLTLGAIADGQSLQRSGSSIVGVAGGVFGTQYQYAASEGESTTTSVTPTQKLKLTTPTLPAGNYHIEWYYEWFRDSAANSFEAQVQLDDTTVLATHLTESSDPTNWHPVGGHVEVTLTNAAHAIDIDFWGESALYTSYIRRARISIWRVS